jgi:tRNA A-37 threonylcarbamoyl transferase component Bud32
VTFEHPESLQRRIAEITGRPAERQARVLLDTSDFMAIDRGDVLRLAECDYLVLGTAREGRFGIDDQPKFWVKIAVDLTSGERKIIKLKFDEAFRSRIGNETFRCVRSAEKESEVLRAMRGHPSFMQGTTALDAAGNPVRILDFIHGPSLYEFLRGIEMPHREYCQTRLAAIMHSVIGCIEAISQLHLAGLHHGDIRADHILIETGSNRYIWIDFDYEVSDPSYDLFCLGNVLLQVAGKGRHSVYDLGQRPGNYPDFKGSLLSTDMSLMFQHRVANLRKLFPYLSPDLNEILMRFSTGCSDPYRDFDELLTDLRSIFPPGEDA